MNRNLFTSPQKSCPPVSTLNLLDYPTVAVHINWLSMSKHLQSDLMCFILEKTRPHTVKGNGKARIQSNNNSFWNMFLWLSKMKKVSIVVFRRCQILCMPWHQPILTEVPVSRQESERSCVCVLEVTCLCARGHVFVC